MIDHVGLDVSDLARSQPFYEAALAPLGIRTWRVENNEAGDPVALMGADEIIFVIAQGSPVGTGSHVAFRAQTPAQVDGFHAAAMTAGGRDNGAPGLRPRYGMRYYAAFVLDPDGLNIEAVCRLPE